MPFEEALAGLEAIIRDLEDGRLGLNESLGRYEEGVRLLKYCHETLNQAERRIQLLTGLDESGAAVTSPFDDEAMTLEEKKEQRGRRRSSSSAASRREGQDPPNSWNTSEGGSSAGEEDDDVDRQKGLF
jgi:exodeoxyribonuclease VII small subunit